DVYTHEVLDQRSSELRVVKVPMVRRPSFVETATFTTAVGRRLRGEHYDVVHSQGEQAPARYTDVFTAASVAVTWLGQRRAEVGWRGLASRVYPPHLMELRCERRCFVPERSLIVAIADGVAR